MTQKKLDVKKLMDRSGKHNRACQALMKYLCDIGHTCARFSGSEVNPADVMACDLHDSQTPLRLIIVSIGRWPAHKARSRLQRFLVKTVHCRGSAVKAVVHNKVWDFSFEPVLPA